MIRNVYVYCALAVSALVYSNQLLRCATLTVTTLLDDNSAGSLRTTIDNAVSGDTIVFSVAGAINLDPVKGELLVDKMLTIDGGDQITIDGGLMIPVCFHITGADASNSLITNIRIERFRNSADDGQAYGILIDTNADGCSVRHCFIRLIQSGKGSIAQAAGICARKTTTYTGPLTHNSISEVSSEHNILGESGSVIGILIEQSVGQPGTPADCSHNEIVLLLSGNANGPSGEVNGIQIDTLYGNCNNNILAEFISGTVSGSFSGQVAGIFIVSSLVGNCINNDIALLFSGDAPNSNSNAVVGIAIGDAQFSIIRSNTIQELRSGAAQELSGAVLGINIFGNANATIAFNTITILISGNSNQDSGSSRGIYIVNKLLGNCNSNIISQLTSGNTQLTSGTIYAIQLENGLIGNCANNVISTLESGSATFRGLAIGIAIEDTIGSATDHAIICNQITAVDGGQTQEEITCGIWLQSGSNYTIKANTIEAIHAHQNMGRAHGILLGNEKLNKNAQNNSIELNTISNITAENGQAFGISIEDADSTGNDILRNSIFDIEKKAINIIDNGVPIDAKVTVSSIRCSDGCKLIIRGYVLPFIISPLFVVQCFVSDSNTPEQTKTFIGEFIHDANQGAAFEVTFSQLPPIQAGQFITATATALINPHNNTSEVSNALPTCEPFSNFCPCPAPQPTPEPCPAIDCDGFIIL